MNQEKAAGYARWAMTECGVAAIIPHLMYPAFLSEEPVERTLGLAAGKEFLKICKEVWVFVVDGLLSSGMVEEIEYAHYLAIPVKYFACKDNIIKHLPHLVGETIPSPADLLPVDEWLKNTVGTLDALAARLKRGESYEALEKEIGELVGEDLPEEDLEKAALWEKLYREDKE